jgi:NAD(P) transhydrogenase
MNIPATDFDLVVIGGGPAGSCGATTAALFGHRVALVEKEAEVGGAGLNSGTVPSKTLRETALALSGWRSRRLFGVDLSLRREATVDDFMRHKDAVSSAGRELVESRMRRLGVELFHGRASFVDPHTICVTGRDGIVTHLRSEIVLLATGSAPWHPPEFPFEDDRVHDSDELLKLKALPKRLIVVGAGVIGSEYAGTFEALGTEVHLVDGRDTLLPFLDREVSRALTSAMTANGIQFHWKETATKCDTSNPKEVVLTFASGATLRGDGVLVCAGRSSNTGELNLGAAGIATGKRGLVPVNEHYRSVVPHIYAAGDVIGPPALAATGMEQARVAVCHAFGILGKSALAPLLPTGIYTIPETSLVGETEEALKEKGVDYIAGRARYADLPRGRIVGDETGFLKLLFRKEDMRLMGVHALGEQATEVVHIGLIAMLAEGTADLFNRACFNYPTLGDLYKYATYDAVLQTAQVGDESRLRSPSAILPAINAGPIPTPT